MEPLILIGYFPKKVAQRPEWLAAAGVTAVRSVSECVSPGPDGWIDHWTHNDHWVYSSIAAALAVVPEGERPAYELHAYRMLPIRWEDGKAVPTPVPKVEVEPLPADFCSVGFDAVERETGTAGFGCSPLSCNHMAEKIATNEHCLLDNLQTAEQAALEFSQGDVEPGPYVVVEVLRRAAVD